MGGKKTKCDYARSSWSQPGRYHGIHSLRAFSCYRRCYKDVYQGRFCTSRRKSFSPHPQPIIAVIPAILTFAVVPFGGQYELWGTNVNLVISDLDVGLLFVFAIASIATYGYVIAGWASNSNWSLLGSMRTASQMISYEVTMGLTIVGVLMVYGSMKLTEIGAAQEDFLSWGFFMQPLGFFMFLAASIAENKRIPFDAPEAESELVAGYFTEYSGLKFGMFFMAEFIEMVTIGAIVTILFFGAWHIPFLSAATILSWLDFLGANGANLVLMLIHIACIFCQGNFLYLVSNDYPLDPPKISLRSNHETWVENSFTTFSSKYSCYWACDSGHPIILRA